MRDAESGNYSLQDLALAGVKWELADSPQPKANSPKPKAESPASTPATPPPAAPIAPVVDASDALESVRAAAAAAGDCEGLRAAIESCGHPLRAFAKTISPHIRSGARVAIITDSPSGDDEEAGAILSGAAGALFDKMLAAIGLSRESVSIIPLVFWRPAGGRTPTREELDLARPLVDRAIQLSATGKPGVILTLGALAALEIADAKIPARHGEFIQGRNRAVVPIFHPHYLLLKPDAKKPVWDALQKLKELLISDC